MKCHKLVIVVIAFGLFWPSDAYRILEIFPLCSRSHNMMFDAVTESLAKRGHQLDVITCYPPREPIPNVNFLFNAIDTHPKMDNIFNFSVMLRYRNNFLNQMTKMLGNDLCHLLGKEALQRIVKNPPNDPPYDLVIVEAFASSCFIGVGALLNVPVVLLSAPIEAPWVDQAIGNPLNTAFYSSFFSKYTHPMSFWDRVKNTIHDRYILYYGRYATSHIQTELMRKHLDPNMPHVTELEKSVALVLVNSFHSVTGVRPITNNLIEIGGIHVEANKEKLTEELQEWLDESKDGLVYFTLGTLVNIETMPEDIIKGLYSSFRKIAPVRVLMKVANKDRLLPGSPDNVMTLSWIPQVPVLAHNNTRVFINHGGLFSILESFYYGVPLIGIPLYIDQPANMMYCKSKGMAEILNSDDLNEQTISAALDKLLNDPSYRKAAKLQSSLFRDRPMSAVNTAVYWIEYVIRNGPNVLKSPAIELSWWQVALLDVYAFILVAVIAAIYIIVSLIKFLLKTVQASTKQSMIKISKRD